MKKVLITGAGSYVGTSFEKYIKKNFADRYEIEAIDMIDGSWREKSFVGYDTVFHVAGIAHSDNGKIDAEKEKLYRRVNTDLTIEVAKKAKRDGVKQFIFMSSSIIYGNSAPIGKEKIITKDTLPSPANCYGESKLQAELGLGELEDDKYKVVILRPPMIYGKGSKGNFPLLEKIACKLPVFPKIKNKRSAIYIGNFVEFVRLMIENEERGIFWPQNEQYINTSELVVLLAEQKGKKIILIPGCKLFLKILGLFCGLVNKAFGNFIYDRNLGMYEFPYQRYNFYDSIKETEREY